MFSFSLPPEVILRILSLLPGKTLPKLRLVSKQFNTLISEPYFLRLHHRHALNSLSTLTAFTPFGGSLTVEVKLFVDDAPPRTLTPIKTYLPLEPNIALEQTQKPITKRFLGEKVRVLSSDHQFLCFLSDKEHFLFDPINQKTLEIPKSSSSSSFGVVSFGFVSSTLQYKLVRFFLPYHPISKFEILTITITTKNYNHHHLKISPWTSQEQECPYHLQPYPPAQADGFLYWITQDVAKIVSFSLEQEKFSVLPPPPCFKDIPNHHDFSLCGIRGNLWLVDYDAREPSMEIWMMSASNGSSWVKTHRIGLKGALTRYYRTFPLRIHDIESDFVLFEVLFPSMMKIYYKHKKEVKDVGELRGGMLQFCHYTDSLLSLMNCTCEH